MSLKVKQESRYEGKDWWKWAVWLDGSRKELGEIDHVTYTLHPTFPTPVARIDDRRSGFRLQSAGWGEFEIHLEIAYKSGARRKRRHWLKLEYPEKARGQREARAPSKGLTLFLSSGAADLTLAHRLRDALRKEDITVRVPEDAEPGLPWERSIDEMIRDADAAVFVISGRPGLQIHGEIEAALKHEVPHIVPLLVGTSVEPPFQLQKYQIVRIEDESEIESAAKKIVEASLGPT